MLIAVDVDSDWVLLNETAKLSSAILDDGWSAVVWVTDTLELWATVGFSRALLAVSTSGADLNSDLLASQTVGSFKGLSSFSAEGSVANASLTAATRVSSLVESLVGVADWVDVVKWAGLDGTLASSNWAAVVLVLSVVAQSFNLAKQAFGSGWSLWTVLSDVLSALDWLAPLLHATSSGIRSESLNLKLGVALDELVTALDDLFDDHTWNIATASSLNALVLLSTVVLVPELTGSVFNSTLVLADMTVSWVDTLGSLENGSLWTEASLFNVINHTPRLVERVELVVLASLWHSWSASGPFLVSIASSRWALGVEVIAIAIVWNNVLVSPVVDTVSTVTAALLSEVVDLVTTSKEGNINVEFTLIVLTVQREFVVASVQEVVWIGDLPTIVEVWVDVNSITLKSEFLLAFVTTVFWLKTLSNPFTLVSWATSNGWLDFLQHVPIIAILLRSASGFIWNGTFLTFASLFLARTVTVHVSGPNINLVSFTQEVVDHWALAVAWCAISSPATAVVMVVGVFIWSTWG